MIAGTYNIIADQGATLSRVITWKDSSGVPVNLTGYTARMQIRPTLDSTTVTLELTTANSRITLGGATGTITLNADSTVMNMSAGAYVYDLEVISGGGAVTRIVMGSFVVRGEVTR